jgi:multidrug efflux pump subunit AcrB
MNLAELSMRKSTVTWVLTVLLIVVGAKSFFSLSWLEDPEFTIKDAIVVTPYPGASSAEVESEVTNKVEKALQQLGQVDWIESTSSRGRSQIKVHIKDPYDKFALPQVWDELRRKVNDVQTQLPPGAGPSVVNDDFGDVYGVFYAITGKGYEPIELYEYAKFLQRELLGAQDVKRIELYGVRTEVVYVEMRRDKMAEFGVSQEQIYRALQAKNLPVTAGNLTLGDEYVAVNPTGEFKSEKEFGDLLISAGTGDQPLVFLRDVADIRRGYEEPPNTLLRYDGEPAVGLAISTVQGGNVITMGKSVGERLSDLRAQSPLGMELHVISDQAAAVTTAIRGFLVNLAEAILIVVVVLLVFMGLRSGLIIGAVLLVTIMGTFIFMAAGDVTLERISLGALVIALGMLVDNAIVVTDGMRIRMSQGEDAIEAAKKILAQTGVPLLMATIIAVTAFASIGTSEDATGEYCRTLFSVILISLMLSWLTAATTTPLLCRAFLMGRRDASTSSSGGDPYGGVFYRLYRSFLTGCIRRRWLTVAIVVAMFVVSLVGFGYVKKSFFPDSTRPQFYIDFFFPEGTHIEETARRMVRAEEMIAAKEGVSHVVDMIGGGQIRFLLTYTPESAYDSFAQLLVDVEDYRRIPELMRSSQQELAEAFPEAIVNTRAFVLGPSTGGKIQLRVCGPDQAELRNLADVAQAIMEADPGTKGVRNESRNRVKIWRPQMAEARSRQAGIDRPMLAQAIESAVEGTTVGVYREKDELLPIVARSPDWERTDFDNLEAIQVWSPAAQRMIPLGQVVTGFDTEFEDPHIWRRDRQTMVRLHADADFELPAEVFARVKAPIEKALGVHAAAILGRPVGDEEWTSATLPVVNNGRLPLKDKPGYYLAWGGEAEDSARAGASLGSSIPLFFGLMVLLVIVQFNSLKKTAIIWLCVPLALIGVTAGLLLFKQPFGFMALLGLMSLSGMLIKNGIVLIEQIGIEIEEGKPQFQAVLDAGVSRLIPVSMAALTTILGMLPLLTDAFFVAMAVTIMFGLGFATILTLVVVPTFYAIFFRVREA